MQSFTDSTDLLGNPQALRENADRDGYLFIRGLIPREEIMELRLQILEILAGEGYVDRDFPLDEAVANHAAIEAIQQEERGYCGVGVPQHVYLAIQKLEAFHRLPHHPNLIALYRDLFGSDVLPHPRHIARLMLPATTASPTPPHQDHVHIQGTLDTWTCWFPIGDCPVDLGSLAVLTASHREGILPVKRSEGAGGLASWLCQIDNPWAGNGFQAGDILTFPSLMVHKSLPNQLRRQIRLSFDARYQPLAEPVFERSLLPHCQLAPWEELYRDWKSDDLKYYWEKYPLNMAEWDESLVRIREDIC